MQKFFEPMRTQSTTDLAPEYAREERDLVWAQRKRRKNRLRQIEAACLSVDEKDGALIALDDADREEWMQLEGTYLGKGFSIETIEAMKKRRSMW